MKGPNQRNRAARRTASRSATPSNATEPQTEGIPIRGGLRVITPNYPRILCECLSPGYIADECPSKQLTMSFVINTIDSIARTATRRGLHTACP